MAGIVKKQFRRHNYPVKTFRGDPALPAYTLYSLWDYSVYLKVSNELDELIEGWPHNRQRTVALLAVRRAFFENGAAHWAEQLVRGENQANTHALTLHERQRTRHHNPALEELYNLNLLLAEAALAESQRRKQHPSAANLLPVYQGRIKRLKITRSRLSPVKNVKLN